MCQDAGRETPGFFIDPGPQHAAPADTDEAHQAIPVRQPENPCADKRGGQEAELAA